MKRLAFALVALSFALAYGHDPGLEASPPAQRKGEDVCLARWKWNTDNRSTPFWEAPFSENAVGVLDLRSLPQMGKPGPIAEGWGLFAYDQPMGWTAMHCMGGDLDASITKSQADTLSLVLDLQMGDIRARTMRGVVRELLVSHGDPTGQTAWKPLSISRKHGVRVFLGGYGRIVHERFNESHLALQNTLEMRWADYRRNKAAGMPLEALQRWTGNDAKRLFDRNPTTEDLNKLLPPEHRDDGWKEPQTTFTESWPTNSTDLTTGQDQAWTEYDGGVEVSGGVVIPSDTNPATFNGAICDTTLSSDDQKHTATFTLGSDANGVAPLVRANSDVNGLDGYELRLFRFATGGNRQLEKVVDSIRTVLDSDSIDPGASGSIFVQADGDQISGESAGDAFGPATDTSITGTLTIGIWENAETTAANAALDDHTAEDLPAAASQVIIIN